MIKSILLLLLITSILYSQDSTQAKILLKVQDDILQLEQRKKEIEKEYQAIQGALTYAYMLKKDIEQKEAVNEDKKKPQKK